MISGLNDIQWLNDVGTLSLLCVAALIVTILLAEFLALSDDANALFRVVRMAPYFSKDTLFYFTFAEPRGGIAWKYSTMGSKNTRDVFSSGLGQNTVHRKQRD